MRADSIYESRHIIYESSKLEIIYESRRIAYMRADVYNMWADL